MFELLADLFAYCWRRLLKAELPDCVTILNELRSGKRATPPMSRGYLWICYLTGFATIVRGAAVALFSTAVVVLLIHANLGWPPFSFDDKRHYLYWGLSFFQEPQTAALHFCLPLAIVTMTTFVVTSLSYYGVARLSTELVGVVCPLSEAAEPPIRIRRRRRNEVA